MTKTIPVTVRSSEGKVSSRRLEEKRAVPPSPSPNLERGQGVRIESLRPGDLVLAHRGRLCRIISVQNKHYRGSLVGLKRKGCERTLWLTPGHLVAVPLPQLPSFKAKLETARLLRRKSTESEDILWQALRNAGLEYKFRRQHILGPFVADFYCPALRLVIEIDGTIHETTDQKAHDEFRQKIIEQCEIDFLRVSSRETERQPAKVIHRIASVVEQRKQQMSYGVRWLAACHLKCGDRVCKGNTQNRTIESLEYIDLAEPLYSLTLESDNSYVTEVCTIHS